MISSFRKLDANDQQQLIGTIVDVKAHDEADDEDSRVRRSIRLSRDFADYVSVFDLAGFWFSEC